MEEIMKIVRKFAKNYNKPYGKYEQEMTKIAKTANTEELRELHRITGTIQDIMYFRLSLEQARNES